MRLIAFSAMILSLFCLTAQAQQGQFLADRHVARGMKCESCHTPDNKVKIGRAHV